MSEGRRRGIPCLLCGGECEGRQWGGMICDKCVASPPKDFVAQQKAEEESADRTAKIERLAKKKLLKSMRPEFKQCTEKPSNPQRYRKTAEGQTPITDGEFHARLVEQGFTCPICLKPYDMRRCKNRDHNRKPCLDHNHATGENRDVVCTRCNLVYGLMEEDTESLARMIAYDERWSSKAVEACDDPDWS